MLPCCVRVFMPPCGMLKQVKASRGGWISLNALVSGGDAAFSLFNHIGSAAAAAVVGLYSRFMFGFYSHNRRVPFPNESRVSNLKKTNKKHLSLEGRVVPTRSTAMNNSSTGISTFSRDSCGGMPAETNCTFHFNLDLHVIWSHASASVFFICHLCDVL